MVVEVVTDERTGSRIDWCPSPTSWSGSHDGKVLMEPQDQTDRRGTPRVVRRHLHWIILALIVVILGSVSFSAYKVREDPENLFSSQAQDFKRARNYFISIIVIAGVLAIVEERRWRRRRPEDPH